jgi:O-antigen ligase
MSWRVFTIVSLIGWGALAFGAVYPWAFVPMFAACALIGLVSCLPRFGRGRVDTLLAAALVLFVIAVAVQLLPLPLDTVRSISPETDIFLQRYILGYPASLERHSLSIQPRETALALASVIALSLFGLGLARSLSYDDASHIARGVSVLGVVMALVGIVQRATWNGKIYGFLTPQEQGEGISFGPFVNRNHFAGWMLMALPLTVGYLCGRVARGMRQVKPGWRNRVLWFSSADASETVLLGFAVLLMAVALTLTMSRSGVLGLFVAVVISGWAVAHRQGSVVRRAALIAYLLFIAIAAAGWAGFDRIADRFAAGESTIGGRAGIWTDTWHIANRFPLVGTGLNTFGTATLFYQTTDTQQHYSAAHNDYLQLLAEGGVLLAGPAVLVVLVFARAVRRRFRAVSVDSTDYWIRTGALTGALALAFQEVFDFSLQMPGNALLFVVLLVLAVRRSAHGRRAEAARATAYGVAVHAQMS